jgi:hypothetical protein
MIPPDPCEIPVDPTRCATRAKSAGAERWRTHGPPHLDPVSTSTSTQKLDPRPFKARSQARRASTLTSTFLDPPFLDPASTPPRPSTPRAQVGKWWNRFTHHDQHHIERELAKGKVIERHKKEVQRLPSAMYDVSAL